METWRLLTTWNRSPGFNMALDEALLLLPSDRPTLRFYTWKPTALSLGYFQRARDVPNLERAALAVRRLTGGGAIHHADELTFSIAASATNRLYRGNVRESYERVHAAIAHALRRLGVPAALRGEHRLASDRDVGGMCFEHSTDIDLVWSDAKGVGSAQRRTRGRILHHGSIKLGPSDLDSSVAAIRDHAPAVDAADVAHAIAEAFAGFFELELVAEDETEPELEHARSRAAHFTSSEFVHRR